MYETEKSRVSFPSFSRTLLLEWRKQTDVFDQVEAHDAESAIFTGPNGAETVAAAFVTPGLLSLLGIAPVQGRLFIEGDGREGTDSQVIVSERFWRKSLGSIEGVVGSTITVNERPYRVIGVMPATFYFPNKPQEIWMPVDPKEPPASRTAAFSMTAFASC